MNYLELNRKTYDLTAKEFCKKILSRKQGDEKIVKRFSGFMDKDIGNIKILDIGPGNGQMSQLLCERGYLVTGIEFSEPMAEVAQSTAPKMKMIVDDFLTHDFADERFFGILAIAFIHLFPKADCIAGLKKMHGLLGSNGCAYISTTKHERSEEGLFRKDNFQSDSLRFRKKFTKNELRNMLLATNFRILKYSENTDTEVAGKIWMNFIVQRESLGSI